LRLFGETVKYFPDGLLTGVERTAIVVRNQLQIYQELGQQVGPSVICSFIDDEDAGILASAVNSETDQVLVALEVGKPATKRQVMQLLGSDSGFTRVLVQ
jgi:hypothetical protein